MPRKVKPKYTAGVLCRDGGKGHRGSDFLLFFASATREQLFREGGLWRRLSRYKKAKRIWRPLKEFTDAYDLTDENGKRCPPPRKGEAFECEVEL